MLNGVNTSCVCHAARNRLLSLRLCGSGLMIAEPDRARRFRKIPPTAVGGFFQILPTLAITDTVLRAGEFKVEWWIQRPFASAQTFFSAFVVGRI